MSLHQALIIGSENCGSSKWKKFLKDPVKVNIWRGKKKYLTANNAYIKQWVYQTMSISSNDYIEQWLYRTMII